MRKSFFLLPFLLSHIFASTQVRYTLSYTDSSESSLKIIIQPSAPISSPNFVMPRSIPGGYQIYPFDKYVENVYAFSTGEEKQTMVKDDNDAPRWYCSDTTKKISRIEYQVNFDKMERHELPGDASIIRPGFVGLLNYNIFGWIDGMEKQTIQCTIETFSQWPIFTTIQPNANPEKEKLNFNSDNYYSLADGQTFIGPHFRVKEYSALVPLFVVSYCQTADEYLDDYAEQEKISMGILKDYFGELPFSQYSIVLRKAIPLEPISAPALAMEHLQSSTFFGDTSGVRLKPMTREQIIRTIPTYLHHMSHAFIPLRCYGDTYKPYVLEIPPIINNIWFNEGFMWFLPYDTLKMEGMKKGFIKNVYETSSIIKKMPLQQLSQIASTMYGIDFRIGKAVFSRGALMAIDMNNYIKEKTGGKKSMKDVFRYLYHWAKGNKRPFTMEEFPSLISKAAGVDLYKIYQKWQMPIEQ